MGFLELILCRVGNLTCLVDFRDLEGLGRNRFLRSKGESATSNALR